MIVSCGTSDRNKNLKQIFSNEEIRQLNFIEEVYQNYLESKYNCNSYHCYNKYLQHLYSFEKEGVLVIEFPKSILVQIVQNTDQNLLNEIWFDYKFENHRYLYLKKKGKYYQFLKLLSKSNTNVENYLNRYEKIGDYSPSLVTGSISSFVKEDFSNKELRLFKAIHFISCSYKSNQ